MSPICVLTQVSEATVRGLLKSPNRLPEFFRHSLPSQHVTQERRGWLRGLFTRKRNQCEIAEPPFEADSRHVALDKSWHAPPFLLTGKGGGGNMPAGFLLSGGTVIEDCRTAKTGSAAAWQRMIASGATLDELHTKLGPARAFTNVEVRSIHSHLATLSWPEVSLRYQPEAMMKLGLYPQFWTEDLHEIGLLLYLRQHFTRLQQFVDTAAASNSGMLVHFVSAAVF